MSKAVEQWVKRAKYDIETAEALMHTDRYLYVMFCCQQAVEKALKAVIAERTNEMPPRIHNLILLAERARVTLSESRDELFRELCKFYIGSRYPEDAEAMEASVTQEDAVGAFAATQEAVQWLLSML